MVTVLAERVLLFAVCVLYLPSVLVALSAFSGEYDPKILDAFGCVTIHALPWETKHIVQQFPGVGSEQHCFHKTAATFSLLPPPPSQTHLRYPVTSSHPAAYTQQRTFNGAACELYLRTLVSPVTSGRL
jgi:hypothetical protein